MTSNSTNAPYLFYWDEVDQAFLPLPLGLDTADLRQLIDFDSMGNGDEVALRLAKLGCGGETASPEF